MFSMTGTIIVKYVITLHLYHKGESDRGCRAWLESHELLGLERFGQTYRTLFNFARTEQANEAIIDAGRMRKLDIDPRFQSTTAAEWKGTSALVGVKQAIVVKGEIEVMEVMEVMGAHGCPLENEKIL